MAAMVRRPARILLPAVLLATGLLFQMLLTELLGFAMPSAHGGGRTRKQKRGNLHNKDRLPTLYEIPLDEAEPEPPLKEEFPEHRVPYTMNVVAQFPDGMNPNMKYLEKKMVNALASTEYLIQHVDVRVQYEGHHHTPKTGKGHKEDFLPPMPLEDDEDEEMPVVAPRARAETAKGEAIAPYIVKVKVDLKNHRSVVLSHPEKHAQATLTEAVDHSADVIRKLLRAEKERNIRFWRKHHQHQKEEIRYGQDWEDSLTEMDMEAEQMELLADKQRDALYRAVEAAGDEVDKAKTAARVLGKAAKTPAPTKTQAAPESEPQQEKKNPLASFLGMFGL